MNIKTYHYPQAFCIDSGLQDLQRIIVMQFINDFKRAVFTDDRQLRKRRMCLEQEQLDNFWQSRTLSEMSKIMSISNPYILNFIISQLLQHYLGARKVTHEAFIVSKVEPNMQQKLCMYVYDCKIFRNIRFPKEENDFLTAFLVLYKEDITIDQPAFEIVDVDNLTPNQWVLQIKESALLRTYNYIRDSIGRTAHPADKIILDDDKYFSFMQTWLKCYYCYNLDGNVRNSFQAVLVLLENQLLRSYISCLSEQSMYQRMYKRPIRRIEKPKNKEQFTLTENHFGQISWQSLKITAFKLKYIVKEDEEHYNCYLVEEQEEGGYEFEDLNTEDQNIMLAFQKIQRIDQQ